jgi:ribosomal protein S18 acetylase RimI-like enzyme
MNMVQTNINYRNLGFCKKNISKFISLMKDKCKNIILKVDKKNINAIKCYISSGFIFSKIYKKLNFYKMIFYYK